MTTEKRGDDIEMAERRPRLFEQNMEYPVAQSDNYPPF